MVTATCLSRSVPADAAAGSARHSVHELPLPHAARDLEADLDLDFFAGHQDWDCDCEGQCECPSPRDPPARQRPQYDQDSGRQRAHCGQRNDGANPGIVAMLSLLPCGEDSSNRKGYEP